jgi:hypothetical protein
VARISASSCSQVHPDIAASSRTMLNVASGRPNNSALRDIFSNSVLSVSNHCAIISAIRAGSSLYAPTPFSSTKETFPSSWQGMYPENEKVPSLVKG